MNRRRQDLRGRVIMIGFSIVAVLLNMLVYADPAAAQCGASGPGDGNTKCGTGALTHNTMGSYDSAFGFDALFSNSTGSYNTASGADALYTNTTGYYNTASGVDALHGNNFYPNTGSFNTASGAEALSNNSTGVANTANGFSALYTNTTGGSNTADGVGALNSNITGSNNIASGWSALSSNTDGTDNTASGAAALQRNTTGKYNIGLGSNAGSNIVAGGNNIEIGNAGTSSDTDTVRIGTNGTQKKTYIAGIYGTTAGGGMPVEVTSSGQLVYVPSSVRYKRDIRDIGAASADLMRLRPVSFRYKHDPSGSLQYGLVAEEVARVYPELVTRGTDGKVEGVRYLEFTALLLNELQKQRRESQEQARKNKELRQENCELRSEVEQVRAEQAREHAVFDKRLAALERSAWASQPEARLSAVALRTETPSPEGRP